MQTAIAVPNTRTNGEETDADAYYVSDVELAWLCNEHNRCTISLPDDELTYLIDSISEYDNGRIFM